MENNRETVTGEINKLISQTMGSIYRIFSKNGVNEGDFVSFLAVLLYSVQSIYVAFDRETATNDILRKQREKQFGDVVKDLMDRGGEIRKHLKKENIALNKEGKANVRTSEGSRDTNNDV